MKNKVAARFFLSLCLAAAMLFGSIAASAQVISSPSEAVELALANDDGLAMARITLDNARISYERAVSANSLGGSAHDLRAAEIAWLKAQNNYKGQVADAVISLTQQLIGLKQSAMSVEVSEINLALSQLTYDRAGQKLRAQIAGESELLDAELALAEATMSRDSTVFDANKGIEQLAKRLGVSQLSTDIEFGFVPVNLAREQSLHVVLANDISLEEAKHALFMAELELERLRLDRVAPLDIKVAENEVTLATFRLANAKEQLEDAVENAVRGVENAAKSYEIAVQRTGIERDRYASTKKQVDAGFLTNENLMSANVSLIQRESALLESLKGYLAAVMQHEKLLGADVTTGALFQGGS